MMWPRILPFAVYMGFIGISSLIPAESSVEILLYPIKTLAVSGLILYFWSTYEELRRPVFSDFQEGTLALGVGILVYIFWVRMDWDWAIQGEMVGYNPFQEGEELGLLFATIRIFGAAVVVPIMEELFWRSFLIRWIINKNFEKISVGTFSISSFGITAILFGLEHQLWLAGVMAGIVYNGLLYKTGRLWPCVVAHATTNLILGIHVLLTGEWHWW
ncbi:MAG: CAAX prenyl protease-related protein [Nitrospira sp.]|nr:CAAX prenyl protease-related protein [Nitrospira sp.]